MAEYAELISFISLSMGAAWASGINLYAAILVLGLGGFSGSVDLPESLQVLENPAVWGAAALMYGVEFFADKIPGVDNAWDALHTFIRIPGGALLASSAFGAEGDTAMQLAAGILGGGITGLTHSAKAGSRVMINTSPEPVTNWGASVTEDAAVFAGLWLAINHPFIFLALLIVFLLFLIWALPKLWRAIKAVFGKIRSWLGKNVESEAGSAGHVVGPAGKPGALASENSTSDTKQ